MKKGHCPKRYVSRIMVLIMLVVALTGCMDQTVNETAKNSEDAAKTTAASETFAEKESAPATEGNTDISYPITLVDQAGREVVLEKPAEEVVSVYYISTATLIALGIKDKVVGIEMKADTRELYKKAAPEFLELPAVGSGKEINIEEIADLTPDLVILPKRLQENIAQLEELNIPVLVIDPETMDNFIECIDLLGKATGSFVKAEQLICYYEETMEGIQNLTENLEDKPKVYLSSGASMLRTCTSKMYQNDMITLAGGESVSAELTDGYWQEVSAEQLLNWNPDYFLRVSYAEYSMEDIFADARLGEINAIKQNQVYTFPSDLEPWDYPTPSSILGVLWLTNRLHPEVYTQEDYIEEAKEFYNTYFAIEVSNEEIGIN